MESNKKKLIKIELKDKLSWENNIKLMTKNEFYFFITDFFSWLNELKNDGLNKEDIAEIISEISAIESSKNMNDLMFDNRLGVIFDELISYCPSPFFWDVDLQIYLEKWKRWFDRDLIK